MDMIDALIIVDMQNYFLNRVNRGTMSKSKKAVMRLIEQVNKQVDWAMENGLPIIALEYAVSGWLTSEAESRTNWRIRQRMRFYKNKWYVLKNEDNGSMEVIDAMHGNEPSSGLAEHRRMVNLAGRKDTLTFRLCGINLDACVSRTACGLVREGHNVEVVTGATCNAWNRATPRTTREEWRKLMERHPLNCQVVKNVA